MDLAGPILCAAEGLSRCRFPPAALESLMTFQQQRSRTHESSMLIPPDVATAASQYQRKRQLEAKHLATMAGQNLIVDWSSDTHAVVLEARVHVRAAYEARVAFRMQVAAFVRTLRVEAVPLPAALRHTRTMVLMLQKSGALEDDGGWLEAEVLEWAIEDYQTVD